MTKKNSRETCQTSWWCGGYKVGGATEVEVKERKDRVEDG